MEPLHLLKGGRNMPLTRFQQGVQDTRPNSGQDTNSHALAFLFGAFALIIGVVLGFNTPQESMR